MRRVCVLLLTMAFCATMFATSSDAYYLKPQKSKDIDVVVGEDHPWGGDDPGNEQLIPKGKGLHRYSMIGNLKTGLSLWLSGIIYEWLSPATVAPTPAAPTSSSTATPQTQNRGSN